MKTFSLTLLLAIICIAVNAQTNYQLPHYTIGKYEKTAIYHYFGGLSISGKGSITVDNSVSTKFVSGMKFYMVIDSIDKGAAPGNSAFRDSSGVNVPLHKGDKFPTPVSFFIVSGKLGFSVVIEGTPTVKGETYLCDLIGNFTTSDDYGLTISKKSEKTCIVDQFEGMEHPEEMNLHIFPNPVASKLMLSGNSGKSAVPYTIFDNLGRKVQNGLLTSPSAELDVHQLIPGNYLIRIGLEVQQTIKFIKQ